MNMSHLVWKEDKAIAVIKNKKEEKEQPPIKYCQENVLGKEAGKSLLQDETIYTSDS